MLSKLLIQERYKTLVSRLEKLKISLADDKKHYSEIQIEINDIKIRILEIEYILYN